MLGKESPDLAPVGFRLAPIRARAPIQRISTTMRAKDGIWLELRPRA